MDDLGQLDPAAIDEVRSEAWPLVRDAEELHDTLLSVGACRRMSRPIGATFFRHLVAQGRAAQCDVVDGPPLWIAAENWPVVRSALPIANVQPALALPAALEREVSKEDAQKILVRGRVEISGPTTADADRGCNLACNRARQNPRSYDWRAKVLYCEAGSRRRRMEWNGASGGFWHAFIAARWKACAGKFSRWTPKRFSVSCLHNMASASPRDCRAARRLQSAIALVEGFRSAGRGLGARLVAGTRGRIRSRAAR